MRPSGTRSAVRGRHIALVALGALVVLAIFAPRLATVCTGFTYTEQHTELPFAPPMSWDIPQFHPSYDGDRSVMDLLLRGAGLEQASAIVCTTASVGPTRCTALDQAQRAFTELRLVMARAWSASRDVRISELRKALGRWPLWLARIEDRCSATGCAVQDLVLASRFLRLDPGDLLRFDADHDGRITREEFPGAPKPSLHVLGTDGLGRDVLVRLARGLRLSVLVGLAAAGLASVAGVVYGGVAGMLEPPYRTALMALVDVLYGLPFMLVVILLIALFGPSIRNLVLAIVAIQWLWVARTLQPLVTSQARSAYVEATFLMGGGRLRALVRHVLPNLARPIGTMAALQVPASIKEEAFLSFLGLGVQPPDSSLGTLIAEGAQRLGQAPWMLIAPSAVLVVLVFLVHMVFEDFSVLSE